MVVHSPLPTLIFQQNIHMLFCELEFAKSKYIVMHNFPVETLISRQYHDTTGYPFGHPPGNPTDATRSSMLFQKASWT